LYRAALLAHSLQLVEDLGLVDLRKIGSLDLNGDSDEGLSDVALGSSVKHLGLDGGSLGRPVDEDDLASVSVALGGVLEVDNGVSAVIGGEVLDQVLVSGRERSSLVQNDRLSVITHSEKEVSVLRGHLEGIEGADDFRIDLYSSLRHFEMMTDAQRIS